MLLDCLDSTTTGTKWYLVSLSTEFADNSKKIIHYSVKLRELDRSDSIAISKAIHPYDVLYRFSITNAPTLS